MLQLTRVGPGPILNNVVFACGAVLLGTELWVHYGCADTVMGLAKADIAEWLRSC